MKKTAYFSLATLLFAQLTSALSDTSGGQTATLQHALAQAYNGSYAIQSSNAGSDAINEQLSQANKKWLPETALSVEGNVSFQDSRGLKYNNTGTALDEFSSNAQSNSAKAAFQVSQNLYNGGKTIAENERLRYAVDESNAGSARTEAEVFFSAAKAYLELFEARTVLEHYQHNVKLLTEQVAQAKAQYEAGTITLADLESTRADLEKAHAELTTQTTKTEIAEGAYVKDIGEFPRYKLALPPLPSELPKTQDDVITITLKNNYKIKEADAQTKMAEQEVNMAKADLLPKVDLSATLSRSLTSSLGTATLNRHNRTRANTAALGATLRIPLDFRGSLQSKTREQKYKAASKRIAALQARRVQLNEVLGAWQNYVNAESKIKQYKAQVKSTALALKGHKEEFRLGNKTYLHVIDATQKYLEANNNLVSSQTKQVIAAYDLLMKMGVLSFKAQNIGINVHESSTTEDIVNTMWGTDIDDYRAFHSPKDAVVAEYEKV